MEPSSSYERTIGEQLQGRLALLLASLMLFAVSVLVVALALASPTAPKYLASFGLILDMLGVVLASYPIFFPLKKPAAPGMQFLSNMPQFRAQLLAEYSEKHGLKMQLGGLMIALGFFMQLLSNWV